MKANKPSEQVKVESEQIAETEIAWLDEDDTKPVPIPISGAENSATTDFDSSVFLYWAVRSGVAELFSESTRTEISECMTVDALLSALSNDFSQRGQKAIVDRFFSQIQSASSDDQVRLAFGQCLHLKPLKQGGLGATHVGCVVSEERLVRRSTGLVEQLVGSLPGDESPAALRKHLEVQIRRVQSERAGRIVIKVPRTDLTSSDSASQLRHIRREARRWAATQGLQHYLVPILDWNVDNTDSPYLVLELIDGVDGIELLQQSGGRLDLGVASLAICQLMGAVYGNARIGLVHGDIKPQNVMFDHGKLRLLDLGLAKFDNERMDESMMEMTTTGMVKGTLAYISPFRFSCDGGLRHLDDLFAAAVSVHYWLTSEYPYMAADNSTRIVDTVNLRQSLLDGNGIQAFEYRPAYDAEASNDPAAADYLEDMGRVLSRLLNPRFLRDVIYGDGGEPFLQRYSEIVDWFRKRSPMRKVELEKFAFGMFETSQRSVGIRPSDATSNVASSLEAAIQHASRQLDREFLHEYRSAKNSAIELSDFIREMTSELPPEYRCREDLPTTIIARHDSVSSGSQRKIGTIGIAASAICLLTAFLFWSATGSDRSAMTAGSSSTESENNRTRRSAIEGKTIESTPTSENVDVIRLRQSMPDRVMRATHGNLLPPPKTFHHGSIYKYDDFVIRYDIPLNTSKDTPRLCQIAAREPTLFDRKTGTQAIHSLSRAEHLHYQYYFDLFTTEFGNYAPSGTPLDPSVYFLHFVTSDLRECTIVAFPGHSFIVAVDERSQILGGCYAVKVHLQKNRLFDFFRLIRFTEVYFPEDEVTGTPASFDRVRVTGPLANEQIGELNNLIRTICNATESSTTGQD